jgi:hypothetical protein
VQNLNRIVLYATKNLFPQRMEGSITAASRYKIFQNISIKKKNNFSRTNISAAIVLPQRLSHKHQASMVYC